MERHGERKGYLGVDLTYDLSNKHPYWEGMTKFSVQETERQNRTPCL